MSKINFLPIVLFIGLSTTLVNCGGGEEKKEEPKADTTVVEEPKEPAYEYTYKIEEVDMPARWIVSAGDSITFDGMSEFFMKNMPNVGKLSGMKKGGQMEAPLSIYNNFSMDKKFYARVAMFVNDSTLKVKAPGKLEKLITGKALKVVYMGDYAKIMNAYNDIRAYLKEKELIGTGTTWEQYVTDPGMEKDTLKWETDIYFPVASGTEK